MPFTPPAGYPYSDDSSPGANDGDIVIAEHVNSVMEYLEDQLPVDILDAAGATASDLDPADLGTPDSGVSNELSRADHVHQMPSAADVGAATESYVDTAISTHSAATDPHGDRAYADALFDSLNGTDYQGTIDCSGNPDYPAADADHSYRVSAAGKIGGASGVDVEIGDVAICLADGTPSGDQATVGANWTVVQNNLNGVVIGPSSSTDNRVALFSGATGRLLKQSTLLISDLATATSVSDHLADTADAHDASAISVDASGFNGNLSTGDTNVQAIAQKLDDLPASALNVPGSVGAGTAVNLSTSFQSILPSTIDLPAAPEEGTLFIVEAGGIQFSNTGGSNRVHSFELRIGSTTFTDTNTTIVPSASVDRYWSLRAVIRVGAGSVQTGQGNWFLWTGFAVDGGGSSEDLSTAKALDLRVRTDVVIGTQTSTLQYFTVIAVTP